MSGEYETLRWPTSMDREAIVAKLVEIRESASSQGHSEIAEFFSGVEDLASPKVGGKVIAALTWLEGKPQYQGVGAQLSMIAMNLKNLK